MVKHSPPGKPLPDLYPGDLVLVHKTGPFGKLIEIGQRVKYRSSPLAHWTHVAISGRGMLVEARFHKGVVQSSVVEYIDLDCLVVNISADHEDREQMLNFMRAALGRKYGLLTDISLGLSMVSGWRFNFGAANTLICSGLAGETLSRGAYIFDIDPSRLVPADIAQHFLRAQ